MPNSEAPVEVTARWVRKGDILNIDGEERVVREMVVVLRMADGESISLDPTDGVSYVKREVITPPDGFEELQQEEVDTEPPSVVT